MMRIAVFLVCVLGVAGGAWAQAAPPPAAPAGPAATPASPYSATVPVAGTSDAQRGAAIAEALTQVLQQVSPGFTASPDMLANASGYVRDYHYRRAASGAGLELQVDFDSGAVGRLLAQGGGTGAPATAGGAAVPAGTSSSSAPAATVAASGTGMLWVGGLDSTHAFAALMSLLRGDDQLHDVVPVGASGDGVLLQVGYSAPLATVIAALEVPNGHLAPAAQAHPGADASLQWNP